ncbi:ADP-ribosylation factor GTPase-activating protein AGD12 isoform B [Glycine soja]|uniref:ADP-ribosylation factor GTPase-activating protein AGD12 isoform B n=1 Tax=Glycine soja TaxID=3848 RepID=A0A445GT26_GLYSO|nr:ADP-ribosylation factor GTPase-activating protein AGD12 isoform B [Glycine soja]
MLVYVDDIIVTCNNHTFIKSLVSELNSEFSIKDLGDLDYFLGIEVSSQPNGSLLLIQSKYIQDLLVKTTMNEANSISSPMVGGCKLTQTGYESFSDPSLYRSVVVLFMKRILRYLKGTINFGLAMQPNFSVSHYSVHAYCDADWASDLDDRRSTLGAAIFLGPNLVYWWSKKQSVVARSSTEAEYQSLALTTAEVTWIQSLLAELKVIEKQVQVVRVRAADQRADILTKALIPSNFTAYRSANIGVFICLKCCGVHRSLGTHISKVLSVTLDDWSEDEIDAMMEVGGNASANSIYEAYIPEGYTKPGPDAGHEQRSKFIRSKYELQEFLKPSLRIVSGKSSLQSSSAKSSFMDSFKSTGSSQRMEGMVEFIGMLKVKVIKGTNLAIRDIKSSDPYVVLSLGQQTVQTTIIRSNLNPVWNEEYMLSVPEHYGQMKLKVFDHDTFSADDIMGEADIDLQSLITSAMAFGDAGMFGNMQIGKWLKSDDNALIEDSTVNIVDGKVKQMMSLKLQDVESGELDLELEWIPLEQ